MFGAAILLIVIIVLSAAILIVRENNSDKVTKGYGKIIGFATLAILSVVISVGAMFVTYFQ